MAIVTFKPQIPEKYNAFCSASESSKQNPRDRTLDLPFFFHYKHMNSLKRHLPIAQGETFLPPGQFCGRVCFGLLVEGVSLSTVTNRFELTYELKKLLLLYCKVCPCFTR